MPCAMPQPSPQAHPQKFGWQAGQRLLHKDAGEMGTIVEVGRQIKVRWDKGRTSYYPRNLPAYVQPTEQ